MLSRILELSLPNSGRIQGHTELQLNKINDKWYNVLGSTAYLTQPFVWWGKLWLGALDRVIELMHREETNLAETHKSAHRTPIVVAHSSIAAP